MGGDVRILVIGPGALGIVTAVRLHQAGHELAVAVRDAGKADRLAGGLTMIDVDGRREHAPVKAVYSPKQFRDADLVIHTTKLHRADKVAKRWMPCLAAGGAFVPFQNGLNADVMQAIAGERYLECSVYWSATLEGEGVSRMTGPGVMAVGRWPTGTTAAAAHVAEVLAAVQPTEARRDMFSIKWSKLILNSAMTTGGVITGGNLYEMTRDKRVLRMLLDALREGKGVAEAAGAHIVNFGPTRVKTLASAPHWLAALGARVVGRKYRHYRSSSAQSLGRGEKTEVDFLNGRIVAEGARLGIPTPIHRWMVETVHAIEDGKAQPGLHHVGAYGWANRQARRAA